MKTRGVICNIVFPFFLMVFSLSVLSASLSDKSQAYTLDMFINESINKYSEIRLAHLNVNRLAYEMDKALSQLGWVLTSQGGYSRDASSLGIQSDTVDFSVGLQKLLKSGNTFSVTGSYAHVDSDQVLFSLSPNPSDTTNLEMNYRIPLLQGENNQQYLHAIRKAELEKNLSELEIQQVKEKLILKLIDVFYAVITIDSRLATVKKSLKRAQQLRIYIKNNITLGLLEKGEVLQVDSQIFSLKLERQKILDLREKQVTLINRFLEMEVSNEFTIDLNNLYQNKKIFSQQEILAAVENHNYEIRRLKIRSELLDSSLTLSRNSAKDKLDVVLSLGVQNRSGNTSTDSIDDTDTTGMVRLEYRSALDKRAFSSERLQLQIDKKSNNERLSSTIEDLKYDTFSLLNQIKRSEKIVKITEHRYLNETKKYQDILKRFRNGRSTTNTVIQFSNDRIRAELDSETERYELAKRFSLLKLKQGYFN